MPDINNNYSQRIIKEGGVMLENKKVRASIKPIGNGDLLELIIEYKDPNDHMFNESTTISKSYLELLILLYTLYLDVEICKKDLIE